MRRLAVVLAGALLISPWLAGAEEGVEPQLSEDRAALVGFNPKTRVQATQAVAPSLGYRRSPPRRSPLSGGQATAQSLLCCPPDDRVEVSDPTQYPFSTVCKVFALYSNGNAYVGTATMVGPRHAVTAGHVVYSASDGGWPDSIFVIPALDGNSQTSTQPFGEHVASNYYTLNGWIQFEDPEYDFGLLEFNTNVGDATGWLGYQWTPFESDLLGETLYTAGYPGDLGAGGVMQFATGPCVDVSARRLAYNGTLDTAGGQSGSGLWVEEDDGPSVVGVHAYGNPSFNSGTRITEGIFNIIEATQAGVDPDPTDFAGQFPFRFGRWNRARAFAGEYVSYEFSVDELTAGGRLLTSLRFRVAPRGSYAVVARPDGTLFVVESGVTVTDYAPQYGRWKMLVFNGTTKVKGIVRMRVKPTSVKYGF